MNATIARLRQVKFHDLRSEAAALKQKLRNRAVLAITLNSSECVIRVVRREGERIWPAKSLTLPFGSEAVVAQAETVGRELATLLAAEGIRERQFVVCIPPGWALTHATDVPDLAGEDLRGYLELRAEKEFPMPISELRLAHSAYTLPSGTRRVTLAAVPARRIAGVEQMVAAAGGKLVSLSLGLDHLLPRAGAPATVHFLANGKHVDVVIAAGGGIAGVRSLATAAPPPEAAFDAASFCREVRITLGRLPDGLRQGVCEARFGGTPASADSLCEKTRGYLGKMGIASPEADAPRGALHAVDEIEAAELFLRDQPATFEFVTPDVKRWQEWLQKADSRQRRWMIAGGVALVLLFVALLLIRAHMVSSLEAEYASHHGAAAELDKIQQSIRRFRPWFDPAPETLTAVEVLAGAFSDNGDTWAKSVQIHVVGPKGGVPESTQVICSGFAKSQPALTDLMERVRSRPGVVEVQRQQVRGGPPIQFTFTYKWEPTHAN